VAAWALGEIGDPSAIPALVVAVGDRDVEVRKYAARSLIKFGKEATDALLEALEDPSEQTRHYAVRALGEIQDPRSAGTLLGLAGKVDRGAPLGAGRLGDRRGSRPSRRRRRPTVRPLRRSSPQRPRRRGPSRS
jgi:HEAT repeat protein